MNSQEQEQLEAEAKYEHKEEMRQAEEDKYKYKMGEQMEANQILHSDALEAMKSIESASIDLIVTDPPYGIGFMGKEWDTFKPSYVKGMVDECGKYPEKDGSSPRQASPAMKAGLYNHSKQGHQIYQEWFTKIATECLRILKPGAFMFVSMTPRQDSLARVLIAIEDAGFNTGFTSMYWAYASGFPKASNIGKMVDKRNGVEREVVGMRNPHLDGGKRTKTSPPQFGCGGEYERKGVKNMQEGMIEVTTPATPQAKALDGSYAGFQPKPAVEVILVAMKPLTEKTYVDQALANGKGVTWLDDCRVPYESERDRSGWSKTGADGSKGYQNTNTFKIRPISSEEIQERCVSNGRFPANLLVSNNAIHNGCNFSRYFDLDKWFCKTFPFFIVPKASKGEKNRGLEGFEEKKMEYETTTRTNKETADKFGCERKSFMQNNHPTVKPLKLMSYLITLGSREDDVVLDPFVGSGTTCIACKMLNRKYIGIENNEEYVKIAEARINAVQPNLFNHAEVK